MKLTNIGIRAVVLAFILAAQPFGWAQDTTMGGDVNLSPAAADVVKLAQSGVGDGVVVPFVQNTQSQFGLSADDIVYLRDLGVSESVITAMITHDQGTPGQPAQSANNQSILAQATAAQVQTPDANTGYSSDAPEDVTYYYDDLAPYGSWVDLEGYGWCWQPTALAVNPAWQPYCDAGHWVYTDSGWFWQSDYTWGWAPFHYGRWFHHEHNGWVWFPDRVWGPAWVTWRMVDNDCGWAPLPLHTVLEADGFVYNGVRVGANFDFGLPASCFTFVGLADFCKPELTHFCLPQPEVGRIFTRTTIINNYEITKNMVVNHGIGVDRVSAATHLAIRPLAIRDVPAGGAKPPEESGVVYRRTPQAPAGRCRRGRRRWMNSIRWWRIRLCRQTIPTAGRWRPKSRQRRLSSRRKNSRNGPRSSHCKTPRSRCGQSNPTKAGRRCRFRNMTRKLWNLEVQNRRPRPGRIRPRRGAREWRSRRMRCRR